MPTLEEILMKQGLTGPATLFSAQNTAQQQAEAQALRTTLSGATSIEDLRNRLTRAATPAAIQLLSKLPKPEEDKVLPPGAALMRGGKPVYTNPLQSRLVDNPNVKIVQDKSGPTGWSYADVKTGRILMTGAPAPTSAAAAATNPSPMGENPDFWYEYYDKTAKLPPMAWGAAGNPTREQFLRDFPKWKARHGGTASNTAGTQASFKANAAALTTVSKDLNTFEPYSKMLNTNADIAINLGRKISQSNSLLANRSLNWMRQNMSSNPDVAEYLAQMRLVQTEAARVINNPRIVGQLTDEARKEIDNVINGNAPIPVVERVLARLKSDGNNRFIAMRAQQQELRTLLGASPGEATTSQVSSEEKAARDAIARGADQAAVRQRYKQRTGKDLP